MITLRAKKIYAV